VVPLEMWQEIRGSEFVARREPYEKTATGGASRPCKKSLTENMNPKAQTFFKNILLATDLSHAGAAIAPYVLEIARIYGSRVCAVHVKTGEWDKLQEQEADRLRDQLKGSACEFLILSGDVLTTLLQLVGLLGIDLIVVGTHGRTGLGRVLVGSVAESVFRAAPCPVLTVGPRLRADPKSALKIKEILYATDIRPVSAAAARYAISLTQENQARLTILSVIPKPKPGEIIESEYHATSTLRRLQKLVPSGTELWCEPYYMVESGEPAEKILEVAGSYKADVIVLGIRPHSIAVATHLSRPTAHRVVAGATCPVLTVRR
jgi:nucleotide-binding universal stress UspA family protein